MGETVAAIRAAYEDAFARFALLDNADLLVACVSLLGPDGDAVALGPALLRLAADGSIEAAAALNMIAARAPSPEREQRANDAAEAIFRRNPAVREELVFDELVRMLEEAAREMGYVATVDPATGETRWRAP